MKRKLTTFALAIAVLASSAQSAAAAWAPVAVIKGQFVYRQPGATPLADGSQAIDLLVYSHAGEVLEDWSVNYHFGADLERFRVDCDWQSGHLESIDGDTDDLSPPPPPERGETRPLTPEANRVDDIGLDLLSHVCGVNDVEWPATPTTAAGLANMARSYLDTPSKLFGPKPKIGPGGPVRLVPRPPSQVKPPPPPSNFPHYPGADWRLVKRHNGGERSMYLDVGHLDRRGDEVRTRAFQMFFDPRRSGPQIALLDIEFDCGTRTVSVSNRLDWSGIGWWPKESRAFVSRMPVVAGGAMDAALTAACKPERTGKGFEFLHQAYEDAVQAEGKRSR